MTSTEQRPLRILIVDADAFFRRGVREILNDEEGMLVVGEALDGERAIELVHELRPNGLDLVLMDIGLPRLSGIAVAERLKAFDPQLAVVMWTVSELDSDLFEAMRVGAVGYLSKSLAPDALVRALRGFRTGESLPMSLAMAQKVLSQIQHRPAQGQTIGPQELPRLTAREMEVYQLIAQGARDREIAAQLVVSESTVKKHVQNILRKLHSRNRAEAVARLRGDAPGKSA